METFAQFIKGALPGSVPFLLIAASVCVLLLYGPQLSRRWGRRGLTMLVLLYWVLSLPGTARLLEAFLTRGYDAITTPEAAQGAEALVILGSGSQTLKARGESLSLAAHTTAFSALEAVRLYRLLGDPLVIASGGLPSPERLGPESEAIRAVLLQKGVPPDRIILESQSRNTYDQARALGPLLRQHGVSRFVLIASSTHMWRADAMFRAQGLEPIPSASRLRSDEGAEPVPPWTPTRQALWDSERASYHYLAMAYAWSRGWLSRPRGS